VKENTRLSVKSETTLLPFLLVNFNNKSRNYVKGVLKRGQVTVDGVVCKNFAQTIYPGQHVGVLANIIPLAEKMSIPIIYEDEDIIVIDKPAGMLAVSTDKEYENTAYHMVSDYIKSKFGEVFIVHRLDRETSGVMLLAKNQQVKRVLQDNWNDMTILRGYIAVVEGEVMIPERQIKSWFKQTKTLFVYSSEKEKDGKLAITNYQTQKVSDNYSLLNISLETGRKNQIRVHMNDIGHPVAGDKKYGASTDPFHRLGLHAAELVIIHPTSKVQMNFKSAMPNIFMKVFTLK